MPLVPCHWIVSPQADATRRHPVSPQRVVRERRWGLPSLCLALALLASARVEAALIINEIHYAPDVKTELVEFVELYNPDPVEADVTGWTLGGGIEYRFPPGTHVAPSGYLIIGENPAALRAKFGTDGALGPWTGKLSNQGDRVILRDAAGQTVDEVEYQLGCPWPTVGDAPGYSIELINPGLDNNLGGSWCASVIGNAAVQNQTLLAAQGVWAYLKGTGEASEPTTAWRQLTFDDSGWSHGQTPVGYGENFITTVLDDMRGRYTSVFLRKTFEVDDPARITSLLLEAQYDDGIKVWINGVNVLNANMATGEVPYDRTAISALENADFVPYPLTAPANYLVRGANVIAVQAHNSSLSSSSDFFFDLRLTAQAGPASRGPTPGARNSVYAENAPPQVRQVDHAPRQPVSGQAVTIRAKVTDPDGVAAVSLQYQVVDPGRYIELGDPAYATGWITLTMNDDGANGDSVAYDGVFSAQVPAEVQVHRRLVRYRIRAADRAGHEVTLPYADDPQPNFAYFVYDGVPEWSGAIQPRSSDPARNTPVRYGTHIMRSLPTYHLLAKKDSVEHATWYDRYAGDLYKWKGTLVYDGQVYDHIGFRARGGVWRYAMGKNMWKFDFNRGHDFEPRDNFGRQYGVSWTKLNLGACIQQGDYQHRGEQGMFEAVGFRLFNLAGVEAPKCHFVQFRIIDEEAESIPTDQYTGDFWGLYLAVEQEDGRFLDEHHLPDGNFYKMEDGTGELNNQGPTGATDKSDLNRFMARYRDVTTPDSWWQTSFSLDRYYSYQTIVQGIHHYDICYGKNYFYYLNPQTGVWSVHPWDLDLTWADNMFDAGCGGRDEFMRVGLLDRPAFQIEWRNRIREIRDLLFNSDQTWQLIDEFAAMIDDPKGGPAFVDADRAMWDYNPIMANTSIVNPSKAGQGRFYQVVPTKDFPGMVLKMKNYVITRGALLDSLADDPLIPNRPTLQSLSAPGFPINRLVFRAAPYRGAYPFAAVQWRLGEVTPATRPPFDPAEPRHYEIEPVWESTELGDAEQPVTLPAEAAKVGHVYRVRARMRDNTGRWSHWSEAIEFTAGPQDNTDALLQHLRLTELMFNPPSGSAFEFVELHNTSTTATLDLAGVNFTQGIDYTFPAGTVMPPDAYLLVVPAAAADNLPAFRAQYGLAADVPILGPYSGALNNAGEQLTLKTAAGGTEIFSFEFGDGPGWPPASSGAGHSLVPLDAALQTESSGSLNNPANWRASTYQNGSPGKADPPPPTGPLLNEIAAHTDFTSELDSNDWIELFNPTDAPIEFGAAWYLSDDPRTLKKWQIPSGTFLSAHGWIVFDEVTGFHNPPSTGFGLSKNGEQVFLSYLPGTGMDRVVDCLRFKAQENDWSTGRYPDGGPFWSALTPRTRGSANPPPPFHLVFSEIMYHPKSDPLNSEDTGHEYVEIFNPTPVPVDLFNTNGTWRLDGGIDFSFPPNTTLAPGGVLLVVGFDPANATALNAFRSTYSLPASGVPLLGPYQGSLNNSSERVALEKPQYADVPNVPPAWVVIDEVIYADQTPWPAAADGTGSSLQRISFPGSGNDPANWTAGEPSPGRGPAVQDSDGDGLPNDWEIAHGLDPNSPDDAGLDADSDGFTNSQEYQAGTDPQDPASALRLTITATSEGSILLRFTAMANKSYTVWTTETLGAGTWQILATIPSASSSHLVELPAAMPATAGQHYYRVGLSAVP